MKYIGLIVVVLGMVSSECRGQVVNFFLARANQTDPAITTFTNIQIGALQTNIAHRGKLLVFFPGTAGVPAAYQDILISAARVGLHGIGLMYPNATSVNQACAFSSNSACHEEIRLEIIDGTNRTDLVDVDRVNSIENRLIKFLAFLDVQWPEANWAQFLDSQTNVVWSNVIVSGHSQGGGMAGILAKQHEVYRCVMFNSFDWWYYTNHPADWIYAPGATPPERLFGFGHNLDPLATSNMLVEAWEAFGMGTSNSVMGVDVDAAPFRGSHMLMTDLTPENFTNANLYHNGTVLDANTPTNAAGRPVYEPLWQYMMVGPTYIPPLEITPLPDGNLECRFETRADITYQLEESADLVTFVTNGPPVAGNGSLVTNVITPVPSTRFFRAVLGY